MFPMVFLGLLTGACFFTLFVIARQERRVRKTIPVARPAGRRHLRLLDGGKP